MFQKLIGDLVLIAASVFIVASVASVWICASLLMGFRY